MSLDYDLSKIKDYETVCYGADPETGEKYLNQLLFNLIWVAINVDLGVIEEGNVDEWRLRLQVLKNLDLHTFKNVPKKEELSKFVGLKTNVITLTRNKWFARLNERFEREALASLQRADENAKAAVSSV